MILDENIRTNKRPNNSGDKVAAGKFKNCITQPPMYWKNKETNWLSDQPFTRFMFFMSINC